MDNSHLIEQLHIIRRIAERGLSIAEKSNAHRDVDIFIHLLDEIKRALLYAK